ncbi:MAG: indole-3-glycerol phosphate synthase [Solirubrobacteraceae bacterium]|nr:indole-3-glycerol phosphate synthase [Solirubrobacteraceae bacterium]
MSAGALTVLERILGETRTALERRKRERPLADAVGDESVRATLRSGAFRDALAAPGISVIAEFKRRSPSAGVLRETPDLGEIVSAYARGGAAAISILTEEPNFGGSIEDLSAARSWCELPLLRKDFIVDPYQLHEARAAGADAVLLIAAALEPSDLAALYGRARTIGLDVLVEVHDRRELHDALSIGAEIVGINNRDLRDFTVDVQRTERLIADVPRGVLVVSESGIVAPEQLARLRERGVHAVLVGESLMRAHDPAAALAALKRF